MSSFLLSNAEGKNGYNDDVGVCFVGGIDLGWDLVKHGLAVPDTRYFAEGQGALSSGDSSDRNRSQTREEQRLDAMPIGGPTAPFGCAAM